MYKRVIQVIGERKGPTSIILSGVHGDETPGIKALQIVLQGIAIEQGTVLFAYGNPHAIKINKRYIEVNLNRMFVDDNMLTRQEKESYEYERAQFLKSYLNKSDALLDIHATSVPNSRPFVICEANAKQIVQYLPVNTVVSGFDKLEPGGTDYYMNINGKIGICLECGYIHNPQSIIIAQKSIFAFLQACGHLTNSYIPHKQSYIQIYKKYFSKTNKFILSKQFKNFEIVRKNQIIGIDGQKQVKATKRSLILFAQNGTKVGAEIFLLGKKRKSLAQLPNCARQQIKSNK